jgi:hypothetical protein
MEPAADIVCVAARLDASRARGAWLRRKSGHRCPPKKPRRLVLPMGRYRGADFDGEKQAARSWRRDCPIGRAGPQGLSGAGASSSIG